MKSIATLTINYLPKTINAIGRKHWSFKQIEAKKCKGLVMVQCVVNRIVDLNLSKASLTFTRHSSREPDFDNLAGSFKHILDGLVEARVIQDDRPSIIGSPVFKWEKCAEKLGHITIMISTED